MNEFRCRFCGKKLCEEDIEAGTLSTKCPRCGNITTKVFSRGGRSPTKTK